MEYHIFIWVRRLGLQELVIIILLNNCGIHQ